MVELGENKKFKKEEEKAILTKAKISANSWAARKAWEDGMKMTPDSKKDLADVNAGLKSILSPAEMMEFSLSVREEVKGLPPEQKLEKTIVISKTKLSEALARS